MTITFFDTLFALRHATARGHITEDQVEAALEQLKGNNFPLDDLRHVLKNIEPADIDACMRLARNVARTGWIDGNPN